MIFRQLIVTGALMIIIILSASCAGQNYVSQPNIEPEITRTTSFESVHSLWAYYQIAFDPERDSFEMIPVRHVSDHFNVLKFLEKSPCTNCVTIMSWADSGQGTKLIDVRITHPFTNKNLTGFDVRGIAMFAGSHSFPKAELTTPNRAKGDGELVNADGYTTLYNGMTAGSGPDGLQGYQKGKYTPPSAPNAKLNGYRRHISSGMTNTRNAFYAGDAIIVTYELDMPDNQFIFGYAVDACWVPPKVKPVTNPMTDFPPEANCPEPWKIVVNQTPIGQGLTDEGGETILTIDVYDYQGKTSYFPPVVECPELFAGTSNAVWKEDGTGFTRYQTTIKNEKLAPQGEYKCLVKVEDTANLDSPDYLDLTAYQIIILNVGDFIPQENLPPVAAAHANTYQINPGGEVQFFDDSTDPDGVADIIKREWDFSYDPVDGFQPGSEEKNPVVTYNNAGTYKVQLRVTDTAGHKDMLDVPLTITVVAGSNSPPVAAAHSDITQANPGQLIKFYCDSTDPDGIDDIIKREWDFTYDPLVGFKTGSEEKNPSISYPKAGVYKVQLRVTDTKMQTDMLDTPLTITVSSGNAPPIACADASNVTPLVNTLVNFYDCSIDPDGFLDMVYFEWDLNGDGIYEKFGKDTTGIYSVGGDYYVQHRVTDTANNQDTLDTPLLIEVNGPPVASAEVDKTDVVIGEYVTLTNTSTDPDGNGPIKDFYWDINGNGSYNDPEDIKNVSPVMINFYSGGTKSIKLKVVDKWGLSDELDTPIVINVQNLPTFCIDLIDQYNSAQSLFGTRTFRYFQGHISELSGLNYKAPNGPWDFTVVPPSQPAICSWLPPSHPEVSTPKSIWPNADFFFKEAAPVSGGTTYVPHEFAFIDAINGNLIMEGQWQASSGPFYYGNTFSITHPICHPWYDSGAGTGNFSGLDFSITWTMQTLGSGPALFIVNGEPIILNCMLIRHQMSFVDTEYGYFSFSLLNYQWIDEEGNEVAFMQADNGLSGNNFSGYNYTGTVICRAYQTKS